MYMHAKLNLGSSKANYTYKNVPRTGNSQYSFKQISATFHAKTLVLYLMQKKEIGPN